MTSMHAFDRVTDYMEPDEEGEDYEDDPDRDLGPPTRRH